MRIHCLKFVLFLQAVTFCLAAQAQQPAPSPLGKLIDLGGYKLHLNCTGHGKPTVVFSNGAGDFSFDWYVVQGEVAKFTRACSYDRGGEAWSDLGPAPRTMRQEAYDLRRLLHKAKEKGPFIVVGQSSGGTVVRIFQQLYPKDVAAMVLVDAAHEDSRLFINGKLQKARELAKDRPVPPVRDHAVPEDKL
jgi:pimeloyl-ACP methyl ester carboxylesterase